MTNKLWLIFKLLCSSWSSTHTLQLTLLNISFFFFSQWSLFFTMKSEDFFHNEVAYNYLKLRFIWQCKCKVAHLTLGSFRKWILFGDWRQMMILYSVSSPGAWQYTSQASGSGTGIEHCALVESVVSVPSLLPVHLLCLLKSLKC